MPYRLLLFDLDGTLLGPDRRIHPENLRALRRLLQAGVKVGFATGRSPACAAAYAAELLPTAALIHFNGALVRHFQDGRIVRALELPMDAALAALGVVEEAGVHVNAYVGDEILIARRSVISAVSEAKDGVPHTVVGDLSAHLRRTGAAPTKLLCIAASPADVPALAARLEQALAGACALVNSEPDYLEVLPKGCSKGAALAALCEDAGVRPAEVIAFGDNLNDLELLEQAGLGVAMGNAHEEVKARADVVIGDHAGRAIAAFLEESFSLEGGALVPRGGWRRTR